MDIDVKQVLIQIVAFLIMLWILKRFGWKPLLNLLEERKRAIQNEFDSIEDSKKDIKKLSEEYEEKLKNIDAEARLKIQESVQEGRKISQEILQETQKQAKIILNKARIEVGNEMTNAKKQFKNDLINLAASISEKMLKEKLDSETHKKLIIDFVEKTDFK